MTQPFNALRQFAYVVPDLDAAIKHWVDVLHTGPFFLFEHFVLEDQTYRGKPSHVDLSLALGNSGGVQIELMIQHNPDEPSVYMEFLNAGRVGLHHFGIMPPDYAAAYARYEDLGYEPAFRGKVAGAELVYFDTVAAIGHFTEFWDNHEVFKGMFETIENAAKGWDGKNPVRTLPV